MNEQQQPMTVESLAEHLQLLDEAEPEDYDELIEHFLISAWPTLKAQTS